ncbi:MAG: energy transducer TonB [Candidatus Acidiferrum sp.]
MAPVPGPEKNLGFLRSCLVDGDADQERRVHRSKQRAILISIALQILIVAALVLLPLLTKGENIAGRVIMFPIPPYARGSSHPSKTRERLTHRQNHPACHFCAPDRIPHGIVTRDPTPPEQNFGDSAGDSDVDRFGDPQGDPNGFLNTDSTRGPKPPEVVQANKTPVIRRISEPVQAAMLYHRVEPVYPTLAIQTRREGRVELHALISTDGSIQSLEVISGDPLFIRSALSAVREWRYHPTILNGQPVEVDTHITVIYTLSH